MCECNHPQAAHGPLIPNVAIRFDGHGPCGVAGCACRQFTWDRWITETEVAQKGQPNV
jgi:hypothetical protein